MGVRRPGLITLFVVTALLILPACNRSDRANDRSQQGLDLTSAEVELLTKVAYEKAQALGYDLKTMDFQLFRKGETYEGYFAPKGKGVLGGDLSIYMNRNGVIIDVRRGA